MNGSRRISVAAALLILLLLQAPAAAPLSADGALSGAVPVECHPAPSGASGGGRSAAPGALAGSPPGEFPAAVSSGQPPLSARLKGAQGAGRAGEGAFTPGGPAGPSSPGNSAGQCGSRDVESREAGGPAGTSGTGGASAAVSGPAEVWSGARPAGAAGARVPAPEEQARAARRETRAPGPDVAVVSISFRGPNPAAGIYGAAMAGRPTELVVTVRNGGPDPAPATDVYVRILDYFGNLMNERSSTIPAIQPGAEEEVSWVWTPAYVTTVSVNATASTAGDTNTSNNGLLLTGVPVALWIDPCDAQGGWSGDIGPGRWQLVSEVVNDPDPSAHSAPTAWYCGGTGAYSNNLDASLITPPLDLTRMNPNYYILFNFNYYGRSQPPDGLETYITDDGGATWYPLFATLSGTRNSDGWYDWVSHWSDYNGNGIADPGEPHEKGLDIMKFCGKVVRIKLRFVSDQNFNDLGFYVDDFVLRGTGNLNDVALLNISAPDVDRLGAAQTFRTAIRNIGQSQQEPFTVYFNISDGTTMSREAPALAPGETAVLEWGWTPSQPGDYTARCTILPSPDEVPGDNSLWRPIHVSSRPTGILLVDDDSGPGNNGALRTYLQADVERAMMDALAPLDFDVYLVANDGDGPGAHILSRYGAVVWLTGFDDCYTSKSGTLSAQDLSSLSSYLDAGGKLWLVSFEAMWDVWTVMGRSDFGRSYLRVTSFSNLEDDRGLPSYLEGVEGDPITGGLSFQTSGAPAGLWDKSDILMNASDSPGIFYQSQYDRHPITGPFNALRYSGRFRLVFLAFEFSFLTDPSERSLLASRVMEWLWSGARLEPGPGGLEKTVLPGEFVRYNLSLVNPEPRGFLIEFLAPSPPSPGWSARTIPQVTGGEPVVEVPASGSLDIALEVGAPASAPAGKLELVTVQVRLLQNPYTLAITARTTVLGVAGVNLSCERPVAIAAPGDEVSFSVLVRNTGNHDSMINLSLGGEAAGWSRLSRSQVFVSGGGTAYVQLTAAVPGDTLAGQHTVTMHARAQQGGSYAEASLVLTIQVNATRLLKIERVAGAAPLNTALSLQTFLRVEVGNYGNVRECATVSLRAGFQGASGWSLPPESVELAPFERGRAVSLSIGVPREAPAGYYELTVRLEAPGDVRDERPVTLGLVRPDLRISPEDVAVSPPSPVVGEEFEVSITVHNGGGGEARVVPIAILLNGDRISSLVLTQPILPGGAATASTFLTAIRYGENELEVVLDPGDEVLETDETNNAASLRFYGRQPDLSPGAMALRPVGGPPSPSNRSVVPGLVEIAVQIMNTGPYCSDARSVEVSFSVDGQPLETVTVSVPAGGRTEASVIWSAKRGTHTLKVVIDRANRVAELSEDNNELELTVSVAEPGAGPAPDITGWLLLAAGALALLIVLSAIALRSRSAREMEWWGRGEEE
ncbi:MAG: CARDB domain-containing protein [Thermoplasmata archaeon]